MSAGGCRLGRPYEVMYVSSSSFCRTPPPPPGELGTRSLGGGVSSAGSSPVEGSPAGGGGQLNGVPAQGVGYYVAM